MLKDFGLRTADDPNAPIESSVNSRWIKDNIHPIRSFTAEVFSDLQFLKEILQDKRIVQLGESSHGVREFNYSKVRLIKFLHQEMNFNVIAFESSAFACYATNKRIRAEEISSVSAMRNGIFDVWHTQEVSELFNYILKTYQTDRPLILAGFDVQLFNFFGPKERSQLLFDIVATVDSSYAASIYHVDSTHYQYRQHLNDQFFKYLENNQETVSKAYHILAEYLLKNQNAIMDKYVGSDIDFFVALQVAYSIPIDLIQIDFFVSDPVKSFSERDKGMAKNFEILAKSIYPDEKIVVWAHNYHVQHDLASVRTGTALEGSISMGSFLHESYRDELYTIGFFMYEGTAAFNDRSVYEILPHASGSLESIFYRARKRVAFLNVEGRKIEIGNEWLFNYTQTLDWGLVPIQLVFSRNYDGLFFIRNVNPPEYL
ncbi:MAG: erythromycin esterase family protein [Bacteroidota bacterium]